MKNEKLAQHISNELWLQKSKVVEVSEYLDITRGVDETPQRDYTGVRFKDKEGTTIFEMRKINKNRYKAIGGFSEFEAKEIDYLISIGTWIEVKEETHIEQSPLVQPKDPLNLFDMNKRIEALEKQVKHLECLSLSTKRNLSIDTPTIDWRKVECLSWEDVVNININCNGIYLWANLETYIKNKLKK